MSLDTLQMFAGLCHLMSSCVFSYVFILPWLRHASACFGQPRKAHFAKAVETVGRFKSHAKTLVDTMLPEDRSHQAERQDFAWTQRSGLLMLTDLLMFSVPYGACVSGESQDFGIESDVT